MDRQMIPKILHWGLFDPGVLSPLNRMCMESWARVLPDYKIMAWNNANGPKRAWFQRALRESPINAHNYMELWSLWKYGGVMLDNDVEVLRPFDLSCEMFVGFQRADTKTDSINCAVMGAIPRHPVIKRCLDRMELRNPTDDPVWCGCGLMTAELYAMGMEGLNVEQVVGGVTVYDKERFYPFFHDQPPIPRERLGPRTFAIHWWEGSWNRKKPKAP